MNFLLTVKFKLIFFHFKQKKMNPKTLIIIDDSKACIASSLNAYQGERMFNDRFDLLEANRNLVSDEKY